MNKKLHTLHSSEKTILAGYLIVLSIGVIIGLIFVAFNTQLTTSGTVQHFNGTEPNPTTLQNTDDFMPENFPVSIHALLINTHGHIISFSFIFLTVLFLFHYSSFPDNKWKRFLLIEPFISIITSFGSIWAMRFINHNFVFIMFISSILLYSNFFFVVCWNLSDLLLKKNNSNKKI